MIELIYPILMKAYRILFSLAFLGLAITAQTIPRTLKFAELVFEANSSTGLIERGNEYARYIRKSPKTKAVIIFYNPRKGTHPLDEGSRRAEYTKGIMVNGYRIAPEKILILNGGYRESTSLEYWIVEDGATIPNPTPTVSLSETINCPEINVAGAWFKHDTKLPLKFSVAVKGEDPDTKLRYNWRTSAGRITAGQSTKMIQVDVSDTDSHRVAAGVQIDGLNPECKSEDYAITEVGRFPFLYSEIQYNYSHLAALLDGVMAALTEDPTLRGLVIFYGPRIGSRFEVEMRMRATKNYMNFRQFPGDRIKIVQGGYRESNAVALFLVPEGIADPKSTPTVDERFVTFTDKKKSRRKT